MFLIGGYIMIRIPVSIQERAYVGAGAMNLKELTQLRAQSVQRENPRHQKAEDFLYQGLAALQYAHETGYTRPEMLKQACVWLIEAMKANRSDTRPCIALAFLFMIIEDHATALEYLQLVLTAEPHNVFALALKETLQEQLLSKQSRQPHSGQATASATSGLAQDAADQEDVDFDQLYEHTRREILAAAHELMTAPQPVAGATPQHVARLRAVRLRGHQLLQDFQQQLEELEQEIDTSALSRLLKPFEVHVRASERLLLLSERSVGLLERITALRQEVLGTSLPVDSETVKQAEQVLETWLDSCDAFADELEALESEELALEPVLSHYEDLIAQVEKYREALDDGIL